jgi:hypothetical protein
MMLGVRWSACGLLCDLLRGEGAVARFVAAFRTRIVRTRVDGYPAEATPGSFFTLILRARQPVDNNTK